MPIDIATCIMLWITCG